MGYFFCLLVLTLAVNAHAQVNSPPPPFFPSAAAGLVEKVFGRAGIEINGEPFLYPVIIGREDKKNQGTGRQREVALSCKFRGLWHLKEAAAVVSDDILIALCSRVELTDEMLQDAKNIHREILEDVPEELKRTLSIHSTAFEPSLKADRWGIFLQGYGFGIVPTVVLTNAEKRVVVSYLDRMLTCIPLEWCPDIYEKMLGLAKRLIAIDWKAL